jgi:hypothetical protein
MAGRVAVSHAETTAHRGHSEEDRRGAAPAPGRQRALPCEIRSQQIIPPALRDTIIQIAEGSRGGS